MFHVPAHKQLDPAKQAGQIVNPVHFVKAPSADFAFRNHGSVVILFPLTAQAKQWVSEHLPEDAPRWAGGIAIEPRYFGDIMHAIDLYGLEIV